MGLPERKPARQPACAFARTLLTLTAVLQYWTMLATAKSALIVGPACAVLTKMEFPVQVPFRSAVMSDAKDKFTKGVDKAASTTKELGKKAIDKSKEAATAAGNKMKDAGQKLKDAGK